MAKSERDELLDLVELALRIIVRELVRPLIEPAPITPGRRRGRVPRNPRENGPIVAASSPPRGLLTEAVDPAVPRSAADQADEIAALIGRQWIPGEPLN
jgi:hypothetical protein